MLKRDFRWPGSLPPSFFGERPPPAPPLPRPTIRPGERELLLGEIEGFLRRTRMATSIFGQRAAGNGSLVQELRNGRRPRAATAAKVRTFIREFQP
jgi:hypothetical protein